ncbi:hypothetical protein Cgig2_031616 [Carnegiea gigantea]|uniref:Uncharacterized protein n=1 Tax=Carnegiea gigantea TaxID=171969 RepID=A0A9Q1QB19_9CARY|nr:hypothetical protein Cgig2_031616 [Carnegiea gigantea]
MSIRSFSSMVAELNKAQTEAVRSMGFDSFLKVDLKFTVTAFDVYVTLGVPIGGGKIIESSRSSTDQEYDEVHAAWVKEWKIEHTVPELTCMLEFILAKKDSGVSFRRNLIIYLVNYFFSGPKNRYYRKSILKYVKDVNQIASLDWCKFVVQKLIRSVRHYKESKSAKGVHFNGLLFFLMVSSSTR